MAQREDQARRKVFRALKRPRGCKRRAMPDRESRPLQEDDLRSPNLRNVRRRNRSEVNCSAHRGASRRNFCGSESLPQGRKQECLWWHVPVYHNGNARVSSHPKEDSRAVEFFRYTFWTPIFGGGYRRHINFVLIYSTYITIILCKSTDLRHKNIKCRKRSMQMEINVIISSKL
jgi:hypothetical protein